MEFVTFRRATGITFTQHLSMIRIAKAKRLLSNPQARISEIAFEAGFASITHFKRMFRRLTGQSPLGLPRTHPSQLSAPGPPTQGSATHTISQK